MRLLACIFVLSVSAAASLVVPAPFRPEEARSGERVGFESVEKSGEEETASLQEVNGDCALGIDSGKTHLREFSMKIHQGYRFSDGRVVKSNDNTADLCFIPDRWLPHRDTLRARRIFVSPTPVDPRKIGDLEKGRGSESVGIPDRGSYLVVESQSGNWYLLRTAERSGKESRGRNRKIHLEGMEIFGVNEIGY